MKIATHVLYQYTVWGAEVFEGIEKKLQRVEDTVSGLAVRFRCSSTAQESVTGELTDIRDKSEFKLFVISLLTCDKHEVTFFPAAFLTEYHDTDLQSLQRLGKKQEHSSDDESGGITLKVCGYSI